MFTAINRPEKLSSSQMRFLKNIVDKGDVGKILHALDTQHTFPLVHRYNYALDLAVNQCNPVLVIEIFSVMKSRNISLDKSIYYTLEHPSLNSLNDLMVMDKNVLQDDEVNLESRKAIIRNTINPEKFTRVGVDESKLDSTCFDTVMVEQIDINEWMDDVDVDDAGNKDIKPQGFVFVELRKDKILISCISKRHLANIVNNMDSRMYHCLTPDNLKNEVDHSKPLGKYGMGEASLVKIPNNESGGWYVYLDNLKSAISIHKSAIIYLTYTLNFNWKVSDSVKYVASDNAMVSNSHCQLGNDDKIYSLSICTEDGILSSKLNLKSWPEKYFEDLWKENRNITDWDVHLAVGITSDDDYYDDSYSRPGASGADFADIDTNDTNANLEDINGPLFDPSRSNTPPMSGEDASVRNFYNLDSGNIVRESDQGFAALDNMIDQQEGVQSIGREFLINMIDLKVKNLDQMDININIGDNITLFIFSNGSDNMAQIIRISQFYRLRRDDTILSQLSMPGFDFVQLRNLLSNLNILNGARISSRFASSLSRFNDYRLSSSLLYDNGREVYSEYMNVIFDDQYLDQQVPTVINPEYGVCFNRLGLELFNYIKDKKGKVGSIFLDWLSNNGQDIKTKSMHAIAFFCGIGTPYTQSQVITDICRQMSTYSSLTGIFKVWYSIWEKTVNVADIFYPLPTTMTLFEVNLLIFEFANHHDTM